jgi:homoserine kinase type II
VGTFTQLGVAEAEALAGRFGLGAVRALAPIVAGTINSNFALDTDAGRYFLRINEGKSEAEVAWEAELVGVLAAAGVPAPVPLVPTGDPDRRYVAWQGSFVSVFAWCPGRHLAPAEVTPAHAAELGRALARLHLAGDAIPPARRRESRYAFAALGERLDRIAAAARADAALAEVVATLADERAVLTAAAPARAAATAGVIHGDLFRDNVLWEAGRITAVLDFEQASAGSFAYDLAVCLNDWCWVDGPVANLATALVAGYQDVRALAPAEVIALPIEVRAAAWRFTITRLTDVYLPGIDNPDKDFREFYRRLVAWRGPDLGRFLPSV